MEVHARRPVRSEGSRWKERKYVDEGLFRWRKGVEGKESSNFVCLIERNGKKRMEMKGKLGPF